LQRIPAAPRRPGGYRIPARAADRFDPEGAVSAFRRSRLAATLAFAWRARCFSTKARGLLKRSQGASSRHVFLSRRMRFQISGEPMFFHNKRLMYTVRVSETNPVLANLMLEQFGGPQGELAAAMRYFSQALAESDSGRKDMLYDIATEEMSHLEVIGTIVVMLNKGIKGAVSEGLTEEGELFRMMNQGGDSHVTALLYGGGPPLTNSGGVPWSAAYVDTIGEPTADLRSNIAAEARAKIIYERLINVTGDAGVKEALGFLMTREVAHQKSFEKALYSIEPNFPPGKLGGRPEFTDKYYDMSQGNGGIRGPWNKGEQWDYVEDLQKMAPVDDDDGGASVETTPEEEELLEHAAARSQSNLIADPTTGADLGAGTAGGGAMTGTEANPASPARRSKRKK
jgi:Mn-containing catalase